jgi:hypothetical protein
MVVPNLRHRNFAIVYESCFVAIGVVSTFSMEFDFWGCGRAVRCGYSSSSEIGRGAGAVGRVAEIGQ